VHRVGRKAAAVRAAHHRVLRVDTRKVVDTRFRLVSREGASDWQEMPSKVEKTIKPANELVNSGDNGRNYDWSRDSRSGGPQSNWQREYRMQHPE
jgi:hypothetical protein